MITICIDNLKSALARTPAAAALEALDRGELQRRLEVTGLETICLRPWDSHRYRVLALLFRLPDLRPEPRIVVLDYLHSNLDLSQPIENNPVSEEAGDRSTPEKTSDADPSPCPQTGAALCPPPSFADAALRTARHPEDLFDRFLNWIAALVS